MKKLALAAGAALCVLVGYAQTVQDDRAQALAVSSEKASPVSTTHGDIIVRDDMLILGGASEENRRSVGIGTDYPNSLAALELGDSDKGLLLNRLSQDQIEMFELALGMADEGMMIYNSSDHRVQVWNGLTWENLSHRVTIEDDFLKTSDGGEVDLGPYLDNTDQQDLSGALQGTKLTIEIENGAPVTIDLSPILQSYEERLLALERQVHALSSKVSVDGMEGSDQAILYQNVPNPFEELTTVKYYIPKGAKSAHLAVSNSLGQLVLNDKTTVRSGEGEHAINCQGFQPGMYYITLYVDREKVDTKRMVIK